MFDRDGFLVELREVAERHGATDSQLLRYAESRRYALDQGAAARGIYEAFVRRALVEGDLVDYRREALDVCARHLGLDQGSALSVEKALTNPDESMKPTSRFQS